MYLGIDVCQPLFDEPLQRGYDACMAQNECPPIPSEQRRDELLRKALATPPISNEQIVRLSKESRSAHRKAR